MARDRILQEVANYLKSLHFSFSDDWLDGCADFFRSENQNVTAVELRTFVVDQWKLADLREMETVSLPPNLVNIRKIMLPGKYAMQVESMLDISISCYAQYQTLLKLSLNEGEEQPTGQVKEVKASRMWEMSLCDGTQVVQALEHEPIRSLNQPLIPGTKVLIMGPVLCRKGKLMLTERNIKVVGGEIDSMIIDNAYENILRRKLGLPLNPDPYNENLAVPAANGAPLPNPGRVPVPCNTNLPPLLPAPPTNPWDEEECSFTDADVPEDRQAMFFDDNDNDLIDADVDAQLLAIEQQHTSISRDNQFIDEFERQCEDVSDVIDLTDDEDLEMVDIEEIERKAMEQSGMQSQRTSLSKQTTAVKNTYHQSFQNPLVNQLSSTGLPSIKANQNPNIHKSNKPNQVVQLQSKAFQPIQQSFQNPSTVPQSEQSFQNSSTVPQSIKVKPVFQNPPPTHESGNHAIQTQSKVRRPTSSQGKPSKLSSPSSTQTKLTSFLKLRKPGEQTSIPPTPETSRASSSQEPVTPKQSSQLNTSNSNLQFSTSKSVSDLTTPKGKSTTSLQQSWNRNEVGTSAQSRSRTASYGSYNDRPLPTMTCGPDDMNEENQGMQCSPQALPPTKPSISAMQIDKEPFVYLHQIVKSPPKSRTVFTVKAFVITIVSKVSIQKNGWHLVAKICDGSAVVEAAFSSDVVESLIGFSPQEVKVMKSEMIRNPNMKEKLKKAFEKAQTALVNLDCLMDVEYPEDGSLPCVIAMTDLTEAHFAALHRRLDSVS